MIDAIILDASKETSIVFGGVTWKPLIGSNLAAQSEKLAASTKATHYVAAGAHSAAVGTTKLPSDKAKEKGRVFYSAAAIFAQAHQSGVIITTQEMPDGRVWIVAAHDGVILRDTDVLLSEDESLALIEEINERHRNAVLIKGEFETFQYLNSRTQLIAVRSGLQKIPTPLKIVVGVLFGLMVLDTSWDQFKKYQKKQALALESQQFIDPQAEWTNALNQWASSVQIDGRKGLIQLFSAVGETPMKIDGWNLSEATCVTVLKGWECSARYDAAVRTNNLGFQANMPKGWTAKWDGLTNAIGQWTVITDRKNIDRALIQTVPDFSLRYISRLQGVFPAFSRIELTAPIVVQIPKPQVHIRGPQGAEMVNVPYPAENTTGIELPSIQTFKMAGPLRSLVVLPLIDETVLKQLRFVVEGRGSEPTLRNSMFTAELVGEFYVR